MWCYCDARFYQDQMILYVLYSTVHVPSTYFEESKLPMNANFLKLSWEKTTQSAAIKVRLNLIILQCSWWWRSKGQTSARSSSCPMMPTWRYWCRWYRQITNSSYQIRYYSTKAPINLSTTLVTTAAVWSWQTLVYMMEHRCRYDLVMLQLPVVPTTHSGRLLAIALLFLLLPLPTGHQLHSVVRLSPPPIIILFHHCRSSIGSNTPSTSCCSTLQRALSCSMPSSIRVWVSSYRPFVQETGKHWGLSS